MADSFPPGLIEDAKNFRPGRRTKFTRLSFYRELVGDMRANGASFKAIALLLSKHGVHVGKTQVGKFCREMLDEPRRRHPRKATKIETRIPAREKMASPIPAQAPQQPSNPQLENRPKKGPRIATLDLFDEP
jgi:hypothetical protein